MLPLGALCSVVRSSLIPLKKYSKAASFLAGQSYYTALSRKTKIAHRHFSPPISSNIYQESSQQESSAIL
jgi:hypothetical protein